VFLCLLLLNWNKKFLFNFTNFPTINFLGGIMNNGGGVFTDILAAAGRIFEVMVEGHWETVGLLFDSVGKGIIRINRNAYSNVNGGGSSLRGSSPEASGYAVPSKAIESKFAE
jgi:chlorosome envelope protein A